LLLVRNLQGRLLRRSLLAQNRRRHRRLRLGRSGCNTLHTSVLRQGCSAQQQ
jgi:hypothetical protein